MSKKALFYQNLKEDIVQCHLCPKNCIIHEGHYGSCNARKNINGELFSMNYGYPISLSFDPIEKKPIFHFLPGSKSLSFGTAACNLNCKFCQNFEISQINPDKLKVKKYLPEDIINLAVEKQVESISYTYTEPTVFYEYVIETAKLAHQNNIKNILVSNGYINKDPLRNLLPYIDAVNIDLKSFNNDFYKKFTGATIKPVLETLKIIKKENVWLEITNLIIPTLNDNSDEIKEMCQWIRDNLGEDTPIHFSRFFPQYQLTNIQKTPAETLMNAKKIADKFLNYVYIGNLISEKGENTYCPKCEKLLIGRSGFGILVNKIKDKKCKCQKKIPGIWDMQ